MTTVNGRNEHRNPCDTTQSRADRRRERLHRLAEIRRREDISQQAVARYLGTSLEIVKAQESETADITLSALYMWQQVLAVPVGELLVDPDTKRLHPDRTRAQMKRLMRTALAIRERTREAGVRRTAQMLIDQLTEIMPELQEIKPWPSATRTARTGEKRRS